MPPRVGIRRRNQKGYGSMIDHPVAVITQDGLAGLITGLHAEGFRVIGPRLRDQAIVYDDIETIADLPAGWTDEQDGGHYRVRRRDDAALFGYNVGPHAWKRFLHPPLLRLWRAEKTADGLAVTETAEPAERYAFLAVRSCELHAIAIQDRVFLQRPIRRSALPGAARGRIHRGGELRPGRRHLLLHLDEHRPEGAGGLRPGAHRAARRAA